MERISEGFKGERSIVTPYSVRGFQAKNAFTSPIFITHIGYYPNAKNHYRERPNGAPENIMILCDQGKGIITYEGEEYELSQNQLFIIPSNKAHSYIANVKNPWSIYWFHFRGEKDEMFSSIFGKVITLRNHRLTDRIALFDEIFHILEMGYYQDNLEYVSVCLIHFLASIKYQNQFSDIYNIESTDIVQKSILFMKENLSSKITLADIAKHVGYSTAHFSNLFSQKTSFSPIDYYNQLKVQKACSLLEFSNMKIKEIAYYLGYYDPFHFSKAFHDEMGIPPKEYRKRYNVISK